MSKQQMKVQVLGIEHRQGKNIEKKIEKYSGYSSTVEYVYSKPTPTAPKQTLVLYTADGELKTKEFDGLWTLEQVTSWDRERFVEDEE